MILAPFVFVMGSLEVNLYLMGDELRREALLVDAGAFGREVEDFLSNNGLKLTDILITHLHHDHIDGLGEYLGRFPGVRVFSPAPLTASPDTRIVTEGDCICAAGFHFSVFKTSGHTSEANSYFCRDERVCFTGDAIFAGSVGGASTDELHAEEIAHLKEKIITLPPETELFSGHGPATTVAIERAGNPFLQPGFTRLP